MIEIQGKYNIAKIFTNIVDSSTMGQILGLCNIEVYKNNKIRIMPDCHAGKGCVIGTTMTIEDAVTPNLVGVDIGCGMLTIKLKEKRIDLPALDSVVRKYIPSGPNVHEEAKDCELNISDLRCYSNGAKIRENLAHKSLGSLGGGNHFIEIDKDNETGELYLVIHTGSRHLGVEVCNFYQNKAYKELKFELNGGNIVTKSEALISDLKAQKRHADIQKEVAYFRKNYTENSPDIAYELAYCTKSLLLCYLHDMHIAQQYASMNRATIAKIILKRAKLHEVERFETIHNYIDIDSMILRKGAVSAQLGEKIIIPINMRDGSLICTGKGNADWNYSAPHGAGRLYSRAETKERFSLSEYKKTMQKNGVYTTSINQGTLDECPMAYKDMQSILNNIQDTAELEKIIKPIYNFKASSLDN